MGGGAPAVLCVPQGYHGYDHLGAEGEAAEFEPVLYLNRRKRKTTRWTGGFAFRTCIHNLKRRVDGSFSAILRCVFLKYTKYSRENAPCLAKKSLAHPASSAVNTGSKSLFKIWRNARQARIFSLGKAI